MYMYVCIFTQSIHVHVYISQMVSFYHGQSCIRFYHGQSCIRELDMMPCAEMHAHRNKPFRMISAREYAQRGSLIET